MNKAPRRAGGQLWTGAGLAYSYISWRIRPAVELRAIPYFQSLGERIERAWLKHSYDETIFPDLVLEELERDPPARQVAVDDILEWIFGPYQAFRQPNQARLFGEPPVVLFEGLRYYIEALFWFSSTTDIHEHSFSGAFTVLAGSSVHSHWRFEPSRTVNSRMLVGRLERESTEILQPNGMRPIRAGARLIHQLFHLEAPSVTIVVRTYLERNQLPQYRYLLPGLAIDQEVEEPTRKRRLLFLEAMARGQIGGLRVYARKLIDGGDLETIYHAFETLTRRNADGELLAELFEAASRRHGEVADIVREACAWQRRTRKVTSVRSKVSDPGARFLLALLMLMPDRDAIFEAIRLHFPETDPLGAIEDWLGRMSGKDTLGFELNGANRNLLRGLIEGLDTEELIRRLGTEFRADTINKHRSKLAAHVKKLARSEILHPLFSESPLKYSGGPELARLL